jgi:hypothetical protein
MGDFFNEIAVIPKHYTQLNGPIVVKFIIHTVQLAWIVS